MQITEEKKVLEYYDALINKRSAYLGSFYAAVKTTHIFCLATCTARKPKFENVDFYTEVKELLQAGFRPCKICRPTENAHTPPKHVEKAFELIKDNPKRKIKDYKLKQNGIPPEKIRRWFQKHYGITFQAYQRMLRINNAFLELKNGKSISNSAFDSAYDSLSGFGYTFKMLTGKSPSQIKSSNLLLIKRLTSPLGPMFACTSEQGICLLEFTDRRMLETEFKDLQKRLNAEITYGEHPLLTQLERELKLYFEGKLKQFKTPLHTPGTDFQNQVWNNLKNIPYGETTSYKELASNMGNPNAARAVAKANGFNRISILIPCHRVIGQNGNLTGYGGGLERKKWLLDFEKNNLM